MRYLDEQDAKDNGIDLDAVGSISRTGSVLGMQKKYGWPKHSQVQVGQYIYNIGVSEVNRLEGLGLLTSKAKKNKC